MLDYLKSEQLKQKRTFHMKLLVIGPAVCLLVCMFLMAGIFMQTASYNWWYTIFLPFTFTYICTSIVTREKKHNYHNLFGAVENKKKLWYAKILMSVLCLLTTILIFCILIIGIGLVFGQGIGIVGDFFAGIVLVLTFAWQLPLWMLVALKGNQFLAVFLSVVCNMGISVFFAPGRLWWVPFAIPTRMMCPVLNILPNGLLMDGNHPLNDTSVILPGILICVALFVVVSLISARIFDKQEA